MTTRDTETLINDYAQLVIVITELTERKAKIEMELTRQMETDGATMLPHSSYKVELKETLAYDPSKLAALRELIDPAELETSGAYIPAHPETKDIPEAWNMTKVKPFAKYGDNVRNVINGAAYVSKSKLSVLAKNPSDVCPLCNAFSPDGKPHAQCADWEQMLADRL